MTYNTYTIALDDIHVSEEMIERALKAAKARAAAIAATQIKVRYAAAAASVVLASVTGGMMYHLYGSGAAPVPPAPAAVAVQSAETAETATVTPTERTSDSSGNTEAPASPATTAAQTVIPDGMTETQSPTATQAPQTTSPATEPPAAATESAPTEPTPTEPAPTAAGIPPELTDDIDRSLLCADGKLYFAIAQTGLTSIDDPDAFSDGHILYIDTKFGRYYQIEPLKINPPDFFLNQPKSDETCYLYNSDGEIIREVPVWW